MVSWHSLDAASSSQHLIALIFIFHALRRFVQTFLPIFRGAIIFITHHEALTVTLGIVEAGGARLDVGLALLELADDGLVALLAVDVTEEFSVNVVLAFTKVSIGSNHYASVVVGTAAIHFNIPSQSPLNSEAILQQLLFQLHPPGKEFGVIF